MIQSTYVFKSHKHSRFFFALALLLLGFNNIVSGQTTLSAWNFPNSPDNATCDQGIAINLAKTISLVNAEASPANTIDFSRSGNTTNCASSLRWDNGANTKCFIFSNLVTTGYNYITFSAIIKGNNGNAPRDFKIQYRHNNGIWTDIGSTISLTTTYSSVAANLSLPSAGNQTDVDIKIIQTSNSRISDGTNNIGTGPSAWVEIDDIEIKGIEENTPTIASYLTALTGFSYPYASGPSAEKSFTISGYILNENITLTPPANFEISTGTGASFVASNLITLPVVGGLVTTTNIYVRLKAGLAEGTIPAENITVSSKGATSKNISCSGIIKPKPLIIVSPDTFTGHTYVLGNGPSTTLSSFNVSGSNLVGNILVTPPTDYQISLSSTNGFTLTPIMFNADAAGNVSSPLIYLRLKSGLAVGTYNELITASSISAISKTVSLNGYVTNAPTIKASTTSLSGFIYTGTGPSSIQSFNLSGSLLTQGITVTPPANYRISLSATGPFVSTAITIPQVGGIVNATPIYVRLQNGSTVSGDNIQDIVCTSLGAINKNIRCNGLVVSSATVLSSPAVINGFSYMLTAGPSLEQTFTVSGAALTTDLTVTVANPLEFEIKTLSGSYGSVITLVRSGTKVDPTIIYIRLKSGLPAAPYSSKKINIASVGATSKQITCNGLVYVQPIITADVADPICSSINLTSVGTGIDNQYWTGPLGFYSLIANPVITSATAANNGDYSVTGSALIGLNIVSNGDFQEGNTGFSSSYGYGGTSSTALSSGGEINGAGLYTVVTIPKDVHSNFSSNPDHSNPHGNQMVINGSKNAGVFVWRQTVNVIPNAFYQFTYWVQSVHPLAPSVLQLYVNGVSAGPEYTADAFINSWKRFTYNWFSGENTDAELSLINQNIEPSGNDFALDDILFQQAVPITSIVNVVVQPTLTPSVSITASASPLYSDVPVTFTAIPVHGGSAPTYQWKVNGSVVAGATGSSYTYTPATGNSVYCVMTSNYPCTTINPVTSNTLTVSTLPNLWIGATTSTDWSVPANWTANKIPSAGDDVVFATNSNNSNLPAKNDLFVDTERTIGNLINTTDKKIVIPPGKSLNVNNTITTDGNPDRILIQSKVDAINGSLIFIQPGLNPSIQATVEMYSKASFIPNGPTNNKYKWQFFGIPISEVTASPTFDGSYVRIYDEKGTTTSNHWIQLNNSSVLTPLTGYEITQASGKTITFKGQLVNTDITRSLAFTISEPVAIYPGQHVFGNPYTAAININQLDFGLQTMAAVFLYNTGTFVDWTTNLGKTSDGTKPGQYTVVPKNYVGIPSIPSQIPSMQGFLVKAISLSPNATFRIPYSSVVVKNSDQQRAPGARKTSSQNRVYTIIDVNGSRSSDRMWLFSEPTCTRGFDNGWDGEKILGSILTPQLYSIEADGDYQVNAVYDINGTDLGFKTGEDTNYTLTFTHENLETQYPAVYLLDLETNTTTDITQSGTIYPFTAQPTTTPVKRFKIVTDPDISTSLKPTDMTPAGLRIFSSQQCIFVHNFSSENGFLYLYDLSGRFIKKLAFTPLGISTFPMVLTPGSYVAKALTDSEEVNEQVIIR